MDIDDETSTSARTLEAVSTCLNEVVDLIDPDFKVKISEFMANKPHSKFLTRELPIFAKKDKIIREIRRNRITIIEGTTGCGKTTQVPQFIMDDSYERGENFNIVVTQPRRIAAKSIAERVCKERDWPIGQLVGYQIGMDKVACENTRLLYCTTGVLLQKLITLKRIDNYTHIIIDEVHERDDETDLLLMVVKKFVWQHCAKVKVILMSATFDVQKFKQYYSLTIRGQIMAPATIEIQQQSHEIFISYLESLKELYCDKLGSDVSKKFDKAEPYLDPEILSLVRELLKKFELIERQSNKKRGAVLIFLPGFDSIAELKKLLEQNVPSDQTWKIYPLHSSITLDEQNRIFEKPIHNERKVILATNIAESSITVPDCEYVIDFCLTKNLVVDPETNYPTLKLEWASQANCRQRAGRTGRTSTGRVFRMVPERFFKALPASSLPELLRTPLENAILKVKRLEMGSPKELLGSCIDKPNILDLKKAILRLKRVGALTVKKGEFYDQEDGDLTFLGELMAQLPLDVQVARFVILGHVFDILDDCIIIAACLSMQNFFINSFNNKLEAYKARLAWADNSWSDPIALYNAYKLYQHFLEARIFSDGSPKAQSWCARNFIQYKRLKDVVMLVKELQRRVEILNLRADPRPNQIRDPLENELILKVVIAGGFYPSYYEKVRLDPQIDYAREVNQKDLRNTVRLNNFPPDVGVVYTNQIRRKLKDVSTSFDLEFENTKAFITFTGNDDPLSDAINNQISVDGKAQTTFFDKRIAKYMALRDQETNIQVYIAVKMGKLSDCQIILEKYPPEYVEQQMAIMKKIRDDKVDRNRYFRREKFKVVGCDNNPIIIPEVRLPSPHQKQVRLFVTEIVSPVDFWAQYVDELTVNTLMDLNQAISSVEFRGNYPNPTTGDYVLAEYVNDSKEVQVYRARVVRVDRNKKEFYLFYIDYGTQKVVSFKDHTCCMKMNDQMPSALFSIPALAIDCKLAQYKPADILAYHQDVSILALHKLHELVDGNRNLVGNIYAVVNKKLMVELYEDSSPRIPIADVMLSHSYIQRHEESPMAKADNAVRRSVHKEDENGMELDALLDKESCYEVIPPEEPGQDEVKLIRGLSRETLKIRGPYSPIQVKFTGITYQDRREDIEVDSNSVNAICLDADTSNSSSRLLVAGHVSMSSTSGKIIVRNTTLMPNIRAFGTIMALVFSPRVELRCEEQKDLYLGAICGLGYDEMTKESYDRYNDMELAFDVVITNEDIKSVNVTRMYLNNLLTDKEEFMDIAGTQLKRCQDRARKYIIDLLTKTRLTNCNQVSSKLRYKWGQLSAVRPVENKTFKTKPILPFIELVRSVDGQTWLERISTHLEGLKAVVLK